VNPKAQRFPFVAIEAMVRVNGEVETVKVEPLG
jgi:hypothetical protein